MQDERREAETLTMTLIAVYTSESCIGRCDAKCYEAQDPHGHCICGGMHHGCGLGQAIDNTRQYAEVMIEKYAGARALHEYRSEIGQTVEQFGLFE
jgi:hypothetical protein